MNVASEWGLTTINYKQLQALYEQYKGRGFRVLAFPSNQFFNHEPGTNEEIKKFVKRYNVTFDMFAKVNVKGPDAIPLYQYLTDDKHSAMISG